MFSDESHHTDGLFRSIAAVSLPYNSVSQITSVSDRLGEKMECSTKGELKWGNVGRRGKTNVKRAKAAVDFALSNLNQELRIDILTWDISDSRHSVAGRDDIENYGRMYFHLHRNLIQRRGINTHWHLRPDKQSRIDWDTIRNCLSSNGTWQQNTQGIQSLLVEEAREIVPYVGTFKEVDSSKVPLVQLADLFAGMAAYTRTNRGVIRGLLAKEKNQLEMFPSDVPAHKAKASDRGRFKVISHLYRCCEWRGLGVSLESEGYLRTGSPLNPINFWHYKPQHPEDKAPTKN